VPAIALFAGALALFSGGRNVFSFLQLIGAGCLVVVVLTHVDEALDLFPRCIVDRSAVLVITSICGARFWG